MSGPELIVSMENREGSGTVEIISEKLLLEKAVNRMDARRIAVERAIDATQVLEDLGVSVLITGSLAKGTFGASSDVDFLVTNCPVELKYRIESLVEDCLGDVPFDVLYIDEIKQDNLKSFTTGAVNARDLCGPAK